MTYQIKQAIIPGLPKQPYRHGAGAFEGVVGHSTATPEASDEREVDYFEEHWDDRQAFVHYFVDWDSIHQIADINYKAWGAGNGNPRFVHVELCETRDAGKFAESYKRYVWLLAYILHSKRLGVTDGKTLVSHDWVSRNLGGTNHTDPIGYLKSHGKSWSQLVADVAVAYSLQDNPPSRPAVIATAPPAGSLGLGSTVTVKKTATHYQTGQPIASFVKGSKYKVLQAKAVNKSNSKRAYLLAGIMSWVLEQDIEESGVSNGAPAPVAPTPVPPAQPKASGIKAVGRIKIVGVRSNAIVMNAPDRNGAANIGTLPLGTVIDISGSVKGKNNPKGYWEVIYNGQRAYVSGQFGKQV